MEFENKSVCTNCEKEFDKGFDFCPHCGQRNKKFDLHLKYFLADFISSSFNIDSKIIQTLRLLIFYPGKLTRAFLSGKRASYVPPVRLYLVTSLVYFTLLSLIGSDIIQIGKSDKTGENQSIIMFMPDDDPSEIPDSLTVDTTNYQQAADSNLQKNDQQISLDTLDELLDIGEDSLLTENSGTKGKWNKIIKEKTKRLSTKEGRRVFVGLLRKYMSIGMFVLMPLTALIFYLLFYRNTYYIQHLVFVLHLQSMMYILFILMNLIGLFFENSFTRGINVFLFLFILFIWIKKFYETGWGKTIWKTLFFLMLYGISFGVFFIVVALVSAWNLS